MSGIRALIVCFLAAAALQAKDTVPSESTGTACRRCAVPYIVRPLGSLDPWSLRQKALRKRLLWHLGVKQMLAGEKAPSFGTPI